MANTNITPNMQLPNPVPGVETGPQYASDIQSCLNVIDQHNHVAGSGVPVPSAGLNINADLPFNSNNATFLRSVRFTPQIANLSLGTDRGCLYESGIDLYYNDGSGNQIRITQSGSVAGSSGTITGLPSGTASAAFGAGTFVFQAATNTPANLDGGSYIIRNNVANSKGLTLSPPNAMAADYQLILPALPGGTSFLQIDTSGNITGSVRVSQGITASNIANQTITATQIANSTITATQIASQTILQSNLALRTVSTTAPAGGVAKSASSGSFTTASGSIVSVVSASLVVTGRPVFVTVIPDESGVANIGGTNSSGVANYQANFFLTNGSQTAKFTTSTTASGDTVVGSQLPPGSLSWLDTSSTSGTITYTFQAQSVGAGGAQANNCKLIAYEI